MIRNILSRSDGEDDERLLVVNSIELLSLKELKVRAEAGKSGESRRSEFALKNAGEDDTDKINRIQDGFMRAILKSHNSRFVLNSGLFEYVEEAEYGEASMVCKLWFAEANSVRTYQKRYSMGLNRFPPRKRSWIWRCLLFGEDRYTIDPNEDEMFTYLEMDDELGGRYLKMGIVEYFDEIMRDISRTFPKLKEFQLKENQTKMLRILFKISYALPDVGYCQGMNYLVGIMLHVFDFNVEHVYSSVMSILIKWEYKKVYNKELVKLREMCFTFNELIKEYLPEIYDRIFYNKLENYCENKITCELFAIQWFLTLFIYDIADTNSATNSIYILDNIIIHDTNNNFNLNVYKIAISLLSRIFNDFEFCDQGGVGSQIEITNVLEYIRSRSKYILANADEVEQVLNDSRKLFVSETMLQRIHIKYNHLNCEYNDYSRNHQLGYGEGSKNADAVTNGTAKETALRLLKKYKLFKRNESDAYVSDDENIPSPFHPYFSI